MPSLAKLSRRERPSLRWFRAALQNLRCGLTWVDASVGLAAAAAFAIVVLGFREPPIPRYSLNEPAREQVRAFEDFTYLDEFATNRLRNEARATIPAVYELRDELVQDQEAGIRGAFQAARRILALSVKERTALAGAGADSEAEFARSLGEPVPADVLSALKRHRFSAELEGQVLKVLDAVLRSGIVADRVRFLQDQQSGIVLRDGVSPVERPLASGYVARDLPAAREYLWQFRMEFPALSQPEREALLRFLESRLVPTLLPNDRETASRKEAAAARVAPVQVRVPRGSEIVRAGEAVTPEIAQQLEALRRLQAVRPAVRRQLGVLFFVAALVYALWRYLVHFQERHRKIRNHALLVLIAAAATLAVVRGLTELSDILARQISLEPLRDPSSLYRAVPFAFGCVLVALLVDVNVGVLSSVLLSVLVGFFYMDIRLTAYALTASLAGIYGIRQYRDRAAILKAGLTIGVVNVLASLSLDFLHAGPVFAEGAVTRAGLGLGGGLLTAALVSMLLPAFEWLFRITTDIRLLELSNLNAPLLRRLSVEAPGTYHHSLMVGTLAESAAEAIGANPLLVRVGAYYHDIGKMLKPAYFVENQAFGMNKHESLSPNMSSLVIVSHVKEGLELAREAGLPEKIRDLIPQHHGTRVMTYFYQKAKESVDSKSADVTEADFRYPGPRPQSKEAAIVMMADAVEAASRTLPNATASRIQAMINRLVDSIIEDHQLDECNITLREISLAKESFLKVLTGIRHRRIDYPGYDFKDPSWESGESSPDPGAEPAKAL